VKPLISLGSYGIPEAARLAQVKQRTVRGWITDSPADRKGFLRANDFPSVSDRHALSFLDLIDLLVVGRFRDAGVSLQTVRRVYALLAERLQSPHPFCHRQLLTDGRSIFMSTVNQAGDRRLEEVLTGQHAMPKVLLPYLRQIEYAPDSQTAARWHIADGVVLDPERAFGKPVIASEGTTTYVLAQAYRANGQDVDLVADLYNVAPVAVKQAVAFEAEYAHSQAA
jgi:uncharacterized protein (DUF433 family)